MNIRISQIRLASQQLLEHRFNNVKDIVDWMGAMQAQDYYMAKWAVGIRLPASTNTLVEDAFRRGEVLRTHVMRPTWHFVTPENLCWMTQLSARRIMSASKSRDRDLGITEQLYSAANDIIARAVEGGNHLSREALSPILERNGIPVDYARMIHFLMRAEVEGIVCSGIPQGKEQTYALYSERVPASSPLHRDEALVKLATNYFRSHCPATLADFSWWSGLSMTEIRFALDAISNDFFEEHIEGNAYIIYKEFSGIKDIGHTLHLLPAFDEYIISYRDRSAILSSADHSKAISSNGVFRPVVLIDGLAAGLWKKPTAKGKILATAFHEHEKIDGTSSYADAVHACLSFMNR